MLDDRRFRLVRLAWTATVVLALAGGVCAAEDGGGPARFTNVGVEGQEGAIRPVIRQSSSSPLDLDRLKRGLAQVRVESGPEAPEPARPPTQGPLALTLDAAIGLALEKNLGVQIATIAKESARQEISRANAALFHPTLGYALTASGERPAADGAPPTRFRTQSLQPFVRQTFPTATSLVLSGDLTREETRNSSSTEQYESTLSLSVVQPVLRGGRTFVVTKPVRDAEFDFRIARERLEAEILRVTARAKRVYYETVLAEQVIEATQAAIDRDKTLIEASQALFQARLVTKRDVFSAELILAQDSARLVSAKADLENARYSLMEVLGLPIGTDAQLLDKEIGFAPIAVELDRWIATALKSRPEVLAIEHLLAKSSLNILVGRNGVLPQLDLVASYGRTDVGSTVGKSLGLAGDVWSLGLVFSIPIGNIAAKTALLQAEMEHARLLRELSQTKRQIELEVRAVGIKLRTSVERMKALTVAIEQAKGKLEVGRAQFALGQATNLDITDAQQSLLNAETDLLTAIVDYKIGLAELEAAVADTSGLRF